MKEYLTFLINGEEYGVDILTVREVRGWSAIRALPHTLDYVLGVLELRGEYIPIVDLRQRFQMPPTDVTGTTVVVILRNQAEQSLGIVVDAVSEVYQFAPAQIKPAPALGDPGRRGFISGLVSVNQRHVVLLAIERLFDFELLEELSISEIE
ncbi:chemotaxis protein CheW [Photobacterium sp. TY1-4]|uniref:chemotaxis protein CheW n=1 Tax=Photobacterium sp. TY1-4 TaxID=2899122 RepID=UPI0021C17C8D|nr:chemotaxis protein CheW [Photobacterium sp. TY1-4]UXI03837.1 chemotaxis protein CheW [Photobacterium sp. TY1-4]